MSVRNTIIQTTFPIIKVSVKMELMLLKPQTDVSFTAPNVKPCSHLVLACVLDDSITGGQV